MDSVKKKRQHMRSVVCSSAIKDYALAYASRSRSWKFERVSMNQLKPHLEGIVRAEIRRIVDAHPSTGKTIMLRSNKRSKNDD